MEDHVSCYSSLDTTWAMRSDLLDDSIALEFSCRGSLIGLDLSVELIPEVMAVLTRAQEHFRALDRT